MTYQGKHGLKPCLKDAHFTLQSKDDPAFVDGLVVLKNPLRPFGLIPGNNDVLHVRLTPQGVEKPVAVANDTLHPILDNPVADFIPPIRAIKLGLLLGEVLEDAFE